MQWDTWTRGTIHPYRADNIIRGLALNNLSDFKTVRTLYINNRGTLWWSWHHKDLAILGTKLKNILSSSRESVKHFKMFDGYSATAFKASEAIYNKNLKNVDNNNLIKLYDKLFLATYPANIILAADIDAFDTVLENFLKDEIMSDLLKKYQLSEAEEAYNALIATTYRTYVNRQEVMIKGFALKDDYSDLVAEKIWKKFWWTNLGWENMRPHSPVDFKRLIKKQAKSKTLVSDIDFLQTIAARNNRMRLAYFKKLGPSVRLKHWLKIFDSYAYYHDLRKELQCKSLYAFHLLMQEVASRLKLRPGDLEWLWHHEVKDLLDGGKINYPEIKRRQHWVAAIAWPSRWFFYSGRSAKDVKDRELPIRKAPVVKMSGLGVAPGRVRGKVKVCMGVMEALEKVKKNNILVTNMTTPDYVPIMKKVRAIITSEGGLTCHAAIIARELKIPCVVGVKNATQVLRDGQKVEVDAKRGIIKIIK